MNEVAEKAEVQETEGQLELEIIDDTPVEDKNKPPRSEEAPVQVPEDDEISTYGENVQKRIKQLKYEYHEERRKKEEASRLQEEAVSYAKKIHEENQKLKKTLAEGEGVLVEQAKGRVEAQLEKAKKEYKEAYETGDPDKLLDAQEKLSNLQNEKYRVDTYKPKKVEEESFKAPEVKQEEKVKEPDPRTKQWADSNPWFGDDTEMTGFAFGVHEKLIKTGYDPVKDGDKYYDAIDEAMRKRFPDKFDEQKNEEEAPVRQTGSVVAPANRSAKKPRRVQLTSTQVALAKRLGITPEQYAAQLLRENSNV